MRKAVFKHIFHHNRGSLRHCRKRKHLHLHIGRKTRMGLSLKLLKGGQAVGRVKRDGVLPFPDHTAHFPELGEDGVHIAAGNIAKLD